MPKSKVSALLSVLLVFVSGAAMGAVGYRLYEVKTVVSPVQAKKPEDFRKLAISHLKDAVKLTDQQIVEVQKIYDWQGEQFMPLKKKTDARIEQDYREFDQQRDQMHDEAVAKMKAILTPEQQPLYEKYLADRAAARAADHKKHQQEQQQQGPGPHNKEGRRPPLP
jgi:hypothetical protein